MLMTLLPCSSSLGPEALAFARCLRRQKNHPPIIRARTSIPPIAIPAIAPPPKLGLLLSLADAATVDWLLPPDCFPLALLPESELPEFVVTSAAEAV